MVEPLLFEGGEKEAWAQLQSVVTAMPRIRVVKATEKYLHAECRSRFFRFVDDLEFKLDAIHKRIEVRSASRTGYFDFGVNRRRVDLIRRSFEQGADVED